jgi:hypothetical protein
MGLYERSGGFLFEGLRIQKMGSFQMANKFFQKKLSKKLSIFEKYRDIQGTTGHK